MIVRYMRDNDITQIVKIYLKCFKGMQKPEHVKKWIKLKHGSYPVNQFFVGILQGKVIGYILWVELGGFRKDAVIELDQIAVTPDYQGKGFGATIIKESLKAVITQLKRRKSRLKLVKTTTGATNEAQKLYKDVLNAKPVATIPDFFRTDEVILISRKTDLANLL